MREEEYGVDILKANNSVSKKLLSELKLLRKQSNKLKLNEKTLTRQAAFVAQNPAPVLQTRYDGIVVETNPATTSLFGRSIKRKTIFSLFSSIKKYQFNKITPSKPFQIEQTIKDKSFLFTIKKDANTKSFYIYGTDITERKRVENALTKVQEDYQDLYNNSPDMYASVDVKSAKILQCNNTFAVKLGYEKEEIVGRLIFDVYHPDSLDAAKKAFNIFIKTGEINNAELQVKRKDGSKIDVMLNVTSVRDENGNILYSRSAWRDITDRKKLEKQLQEAQKLKAIGQLAAGVAHDFNNHLAAIVGYTELCLMSVAKGSLVPTDLLGIMNSTRKDAN